MGFFSGFLAWLVTSDNNPKSSFYMLKLRHVIQVEANREKYGVFTTFKAAYDSLVNQGFEIKSYKYELRRFSVADEVKLLAVKREKSYYTLHFKRVDVNRPLLLLY